MADTISRSEFFANPGYLLDRTVARGEHVGSIPVNIERIVQEQDLGSIHGKALIDLVEGTLAHHGFVLATHKTHQEDHSYQVTFVRGPDEMALRISQNGGGEKFSLVGNVQINKRGSSNGSGVDFSEKDLIGLLSDEFPDAEFFERFSGMTGKRSLHPGYHQFAEQARRVHQSFESSQPGSLGASWSEGTETIYFEGELRKVDVRKFKPVINGPSLRRQDGIASLAGTYLIESFPYGRFTRYTHQIAAVHAMTLLCQHLGITDQELMVNRAHALIHDIGHTFFGHPGEDTFRFKEREGYMRFDHEKAATWFISRERHLFDAIQPGLADMMIAMLKKEHPHHVLLSADLGGADRLGFLASDPWQVGGSPRYRPSRLIPHMHFDEWGLWCDSPEEAFEFLNFHGICYEFGYYGLQKQIEDAHTKKILTAANFLDIMDQVRIVQAGYPMGAPLWQLNDAEMNFYLCTEHPDDAVKKMARYRLLGSRSTAATTVGQIKIKGYEDSSGRVKVPDFNGLTYMEKRPRVEGMDLGQLDEYYRFWQDPSNQAIIERVAARHLGIPLEYVVVAGAPYKKRSADAPIRPNGRGEIIQLFDIDKGRYRTPFDERTNRMAGLQIAVHPRFWDKAFEGLEKTPFSTIVREAYQESRRKVA